MEGVMVVSVLREDSFVIFIFETDVIFFSALTLCSITLTSPTNGEVWKQLKNGADKTIYLILCKLI